MFNKIRTYLSDPQHKKLLPFVIVIAIVLTVPLTVVLSLNQQTIRQRASELISPPSPPFPISTPSPTPTPLPSVTVIYPNGGEKWEIGKTYDVTWNYFGSSSCTVKVYLIHQKNYNLYGDNTTPILASLKKYSFVIPTNIPLGESLYRIEVKGEPCGFSDQSDSNLSIVASPTPIPKPTSCGNYGDLDLDGTVSSIDTNLMLRFIVGSATPTAEQKKRADLNGDGKINVQDSILLQRFIAKKITTFPVCASVTITPISNPIPTRTPTPKPTNTPTPTKTPTLKPTNTPIPTKTPTPIIHGNPTPILAPASTIIKLSPPVNSLTPNALGQVTVETLSYDRTAQILTVKIKGNLSGLKSFKTYRVLLCSYDGKLCASNHEPEISTSQTGASTFSNITFNVFTNSLSFVKVVEKVPFGLQPSSTICWNSFSPCLQGKF